MPRSINRELEPSADFFPQPAGGNTNGVPRPQTTPEAAEPQVEALRLAEETSSASAEEEWNLDALRLSQDFGLEVGGKAVLTAVAVRTPTRQEFIRVRPDPGWHMAVALLEVEEENNARYAITIDLQKEHANYVQPVVLVLAMNRAGKLFLWPVKLPKGGKDANAWLASAQEGAQLAQTYWVKIASNREKGEYDVTQATAPYPQPEWPGDLTFAEVFKLAFKGRVIAQRDHPVLRRLRGEI
jgi:hypothetical protein